MQKKFFLSLRLSFVFLLVFSSISPAHNASRYFPFLEKPEEYVTKKKSYIYPAFFITSASTAFRRSGGNAGIPELWGMYDLKDVIESVEAVKLASGVASYNPFAQEVGYSDWNKKEIKYYVHEKIKSRGVLLNLEQNLFKSPFSVGVSLPLMYVNTSMRFVFDSENSHSDVRLASPQEVEMLDRVRRSVHKDLCLRGVDWATSGVGDLDAHLRWRAFWDHVLKMRSIDLNVQAGAIIPLGTKRDENYPSSIPFMGNGHFGIYGDLVTEFELKQDWKLGGMFSLIHQWKKTDVRRIPYYKEPAMFSALSGDVEVDPGLTLKASPYFILENMLDGLHFQVRYTYLRHSPDAWKDKRANKSVLSYLELEKDDIISVRNTKKYLSKWTSHHLSLQLAYDSAEAMKNWLFDPKIYVVYDYPLAGRGCCKTHQLTVGAELHF